jgi:hypothetical protein
VGPEPSYELLQAFINTPGVPVLRGDEAGEIGAFIHWVTASATLRSVGADPNAQVIAPLGDLDGARASPPAGSDLGL